MSDINICTFTGRLGADPEIKSFQSGGRVANLRMAVGQQWKDKNSGDRKERVEWVSVAIANDGLVGVAERFLRKGSRIAISGEFRTRKWQDREGQDRYSTEIVLTPFNGTLTMLDGKPESEQRNERNRNADSGGNSGGGWGSNDRSDAGWGDDLNDEVPF